MPKIVQQLFFHDRRVGWVLAYLGTCDKYEWRETLKHPERARFREEQVGSRMSILDKHVR
jgi:hypothetical protein